MFRPAKDIIEPTSPSTRRSMRRVCNEITTDNEEEMIGNLLLVALITAVEYGGADLDDLPTEDSFAFIDDILAKLTTKVESMIPSDT